MFSAALLLLGTCHAHMGMYLSAALLLLGTCHAHMGMTITPAGTRLYPRSKATKFDAYRNPNDPAVGHACHGTTKGSVIATFSAGTSVTATTSYGAGHGGGHCAWMISEDQNTWYKFAEVPDCTSQSSDGQQFDFTPPANAPASCASESGCILGFFWSPKLSGGCETYSNCFDVKITGATGGMKTNNPSITTPISQCVRIDSTTLLTPMFGAKVGTGGGGNAGGGGSPGGGDNAGGENAGGGTGTSCVTYTVVQGDTLTKIASEFDVVGGYQKIFQLNMETMKDENTIEIGQVLKMPGGDCLKDGDVPATTPSGDNGNNGNKNNGGANVDGTDERMDTGGIVVLVLFVLALVSSVTFFVGYTLGKRKGVQESPNVAVAMGNKV